jgi:hypothetical protein
MSAGGMAMVYRTNPSRNSEFISQLRTIFSGAEGIDRVVTVSDFPKLGLPLPGASDQAPDLVLAAKPDDVFAHETAGEYVTQVAVGGTHGYLNTDLKMQAIFIAWGRDIPKEVRLDSTSNLDVALP